MGQFWMTRSIRPFNISTLMKRVICGNILTTENRAM